MRVNNCQYPTPNDDRRYAIRNMQTMKLRVRVRPQATREGIIERNNVLIVAVREPAREGRANKAVCRALARRLGVSAGSVRIVRGKKSCEKTIVIE